MTKVIPIPKLPEDATPEEKAQYEEYLKQTSQQLKVEIKTPGVEVTGEVTKDDSWSVIGMALVLVLGVYLGIKLINKYIR